MFISKVLLIKSIRGAFDCENTQMLLLKLSSYGVGGVCSSLIRSHLTIGDQYVIANGFMSSVLPFGVGLPQSSVLGPLLFNIFIIDIVRIDGVKCI